MQAAQVSEERSDECDRLDDLEAQKHRSFSVKAFAR